ncbi:Uncharacterized protein potentially involved in peptidoglycan biosynthesis [Dermatophilus congolensis]|uniref:Uncharacterized protein potentially involved in peptidoglycan biosynthesis n=1 Tax=Dermatophilus congolensis TaxID=1863 RepID=A0AA46H0C2_9MICO|nr:Uncharacterized protein potentially involved in peptidoglycan biosynthesis [Dermatophilus congolensis]
MRIRHLSVATAIALLAPMVTVVSPGIFDASADPIPVSTEKTEVALQAPEATAGTGKALTARDKKLAQEQAATAELSPAAKKNPHVLEISPEQKVPAPLTVMGVTWKAGTGTDVVVQYRLRTAAGWGEWKAVEAESGEEKADPNASSTRAGSDPIVVTEATHAQVRTLGPVGQDTVDAKLSLIDPNESPADSTVGTVAPGSAAAAVNRPWINSRAAWGADESLRRNAPSYGVVRGAVIHHTEGTNNYSQSQVPAILRGIYAFHVKDRGWSDIGYNFLVDKWGRIWEGRAGGTNSAVVGAHAYGTNSVTTGVSVMGNHSQAPISNAAVNAVERVIAWKASIHGFNPQGTQTIYGRTYPAIVGHRDVGATECPGDYFYSRLPQIRRDVARMVRNGNGSNGVPGGVSRPPAPAPAPAPKPPVSTPGNQLVGAADVIMRGTSNALFASAYTGNDLAFARKIHSGNFASYGSVVAAGDLNRDGRGDVLGVDHKGRMYLFTGKNDGTLANGRQVGHGWAAMRSLTAGADFTGDRIPDMLATNRSGRLYLYPGKGNGTFHRARPIGSGWHTFKQIMNMGDWSGDGKTDVIGVRNDGRAFLYTGSGTGKFSSKAIPLDGYYGAMRSLTPLVGKAAFVGVDKDGIGFLIKKNGARGTTINITTPNFIGLTVYSG